MKRLSLLVILSVFFITAFSQTIQKITWENQGNKYDALLLYKNNSDILVHIKYDNNGVKKIAKFKAEKVYNPSNAINDIVIRPTTATTTIYSSNKDLSKYLKPLNFVLTNFNKETNKGDKWIVVNNEELKNPSVKANKPKANNYYYKNIEELTTNVNLSSYFTNTDEDYKSLLANNFFTKNNIAKPTTLSNHKPTVHLLLVGDTLDVAIGSDVVQDLEAISNQIKQALSYSPQISLKTILLAGKDLTGDKVSNALKNLSVNPNDAVIFYYSGHGYNYEKKFKKSEFPSMHMLSNDLALEDIHNYLVETKQPRFSLVMGDLCNTTIRRRPKAETGLLLRAGKRPKINQEDIDRLFLYAKGHLLSTSSSYDQYSFSINNRGAFSQSFFDVFNDTIMGMNGDPDWKVILKKSYENAYNLTKNIENKNNQWGQQGFMKGQVSYLTN